MDRELRDRWVAALRSGKYEQGQYHLNRNGNFCCLGVLCETNNIKKRLVLPEYDEYEYKIKNIGDGCDRFKSWTGHDLPLGFCGLTTKQIRKLAELNDDDRASFAEIADWIEANL